MERVKIISNPYKQKNEFYSFDEGTNEWQKIDRQTCPKSRLLNDDLVKGFFPFKVKEIIDILVDEYGVGSNGLEITFEGTPDDFKELIGVCYNDEYDCQIELKNDSSYLLNAREVLPKIVQVFTDLRPIIDSSENNKEEIKSNLDRFSDATKDIIPLCVMGNYSAGKSTFINALIGNEILPSGDEPVTAKVFKINQSENDNYASIELIYDHSQIRILFINNTHEVLGNNLYARPSDSLDA